MPTNSIDICTGQVQTPFQKLSHLVMDVSSAKSLEEEKMVKDWNGVETLPYPHVPLGSGT